ncbi:MAG: hypothetical protein JXR97_13015, partial [Planctomycetes bacterium]|nr:hypothetical protein [Planctomycetota bacterium]
DDGWQGNDYEKWAPDAERYPEGWGNVVGKARELGLKLGVWAAAMPITLEDLKKLYKDAGFCSYKLDFAKLNNNDEIHALMNKVREFIKSTDHNVRTNWDVTEGLRRYGYFFAREYGSLYLSNRKPVSPFTTVYRPHTMLRDLWEISKYMHLPKFQGTIQNIERVNREFSDAHLYTHAYSVAITLMSQPLFFQQTFYYDEKARAEIRPLLAAYKQHKEAIVGGSISPIGEKPDGASWAGFQSSSPDSASGYLTVFRELNNDDAEYSMALKNMAGRTVEIEDLLTGGETRTVKADNAGRVSFALPTPASFVFARYECRD